MWNIRGQAGIRLLREVIGIIPRPSQYYLKKKHEKKTRKKWKKRSLSDKYMLGIFEATV